MIRNHDDQVVIFWLLVGIAVLVYFSRRCKTASTAFGSAAWASDSMFKAAGMLADKGLILGRTFKGVLLRLPHYCHVLLVGGSGSGKGVSVVLTNLLTYRRGSIVCFDPKGDLHETAGFRRAAMGQRIRRLAPFDGGQDKFNPLSTISADSPVLVDSARALAESLVVRLGTETDPHWNEKAVQVISALLVLVLLLLKDEERNLNSVQEIASDPNLVKAAAKKLREIGGIPGRLGNQLLALFDKEGGELTKEGAGILSTVSRHLTFLDSEPVSRAVANSSFDPLELLKPGTTLFIQIPPAQLEAQRSLLRCWISTLIRVIGANGNERDSEVLMLLDEASALGNSLPAIEEALVRGRSASLRMLLAYQSNSQVEAAFKEKRTLLYDNCSVHIYLGAASSYEQAERISKSLGEWTQVVESYGSNESRSWQEAQPGRQNSYGNSQNYSQHGRALLRPEEVMTLNNDNLICFVRGMAPILARRVKWYEDKLFNPSAAASQPPKRNPFWWALVAVVAALYAWAIISK